MVDEIRSIALSVIISTSVRSNALLNCLESLERQTQPTDTWEVIVVVGESTDETQQHLDQLQVSFHLRVVQQEYPDTTNALKYGIEAAVGRYCLILTDACTADPDLIAAHLHLQQTANGCIGLGMLRRQVSSQAGWYAQAYAKYWNQHYVRLSDGQLEPMWSDGVVANLSSSREVMSDALSLMPSEPISFELELFYILTQRGQHIAYIPQAKVNCIENSNFTSLITAAGQCGQLHAKLWQHDPAMLTRQLGSFIDAPPYILMVRRLLLSLNIPPLALGSLHRLIQRKDEWFKFVHDYSYWHGAKQVIDDHDTWQRLTHGTTILMYHAFTNSHERHNRYVVSSRQFTWQMRLLKWLNYHVLSLNDYVELRAKQDLPPLRSVVITADDGYTDNCTVAYPILRQYGYPATIFLVSNLMGSVNQWDESGLLKDRPLMTSEQITEMMQHGITFGAHTCNHPKLTSVSSAQAHEEIAGSQAALEKILDHHIDLFCYPHGLYNEEIRAIVEQSGFASACTTLPGQNSALTPIFELRRTDVRGYDSLLRFALALWLGDSHRPMLRRRSL